VRGIQAVTVSAETGRGLDKLMEAVLKTHQVWNRRVSTGRLNRWLEGVLAHHPPPAVAGRRLKIKYITQAKTRPPGFVALVLAPGRRAAVLRPLSGQQPARRLRHAGRADPHRAARVRPRRTLSFAGRAKKRN
jgi:GTP-binding protein